MKELVIYTLFALLFGYWESIMYYDPFAKVKFWSKAFYQRAKVTFLDNYFPIDGGHLLKQALIILLCAMPWLYSDYTVVQGLTRSLINYAVLSLIFNGVLHTTKHK